MNTVPVLLDAVAVDNGTDLIARIGQQGINSYSIIRVNITGPGGIFTMYKGTISDIARFTTVRTGVVNDAQFIPPEYIPSGNDVIGVWAGGTGGSGRMTLTTDGG